MLKMLSFVLILSACGDDVAPPGPRIETWEDAENVWSDAWCTYAENCYLDDFPLFYDSHADCVTQVTEENCSGPRFPDCSDPYDRTRLAPLQQCHDEMAEIECTAQFAPDACYVAFAQYE